MAAVARQLKVSPLTVKRWVANDRVPPRKAIKLANALDIEIHEILPFAERAPSASKPAIQKTLSDLDTINDYFYGRQTATHLPQNSIRATLTHWGDKWPLLYETLNRLGRREIGVTEASKILGVALPTVHNLRRRYGLAPGALKRTKPRNRPAKKKRDVALDLALDVISGRMTASAAGKSSPEVSLRTLHRYIEDLIRPETLNEMAHWSTNFRHAYALDVEKKRTKVVPNWRKLAESRGFILKKKPRWPEPVENWRKAPLWRLAVAELAGELDLEEIARLRGGSFEVLRGLIDSFVGQYGIDGWQRSIYHQAAAAEIILAHQSNFRSGVRV